MLFAILTKFMFLFVKVVNKYIDQGVAELVPGVLFVDEVCAQNKTSSIII